LVATFVGAMARPIMKLKLAARLFVLGQQKAQVAMFP
jgi:hypothetical protein